MSVLIEQSVLTADKSIGAALRPVEGSLHAGLEGLPCSRLLRVHGVNGAGCHGLRLTQAGVFGRGQLWGERPNCCGRWGVLLRGEGESLALWGWERAAALCALGLLVVGLGFREGSCVEPCFAVWHNGRAFGFGGDRRRHFGWNFWSRLEKWRETSKISLCAKLRGHCAFICM